MGELTLTIRFADEDALREFVLEARAYSILRPEAGVRHADALDMDGRAHPGQYVLSTCGPGHWLVFPADACKHCGRRHERVPEDLCAPARAEYDRVDALGRELGVASDPVVHGPEMTLRRCADCGAPVYMHRDSDAATAQQVRCDGCEEAAFARWVRGTGT